MTYYRKHRYYPVYPQIRAIWSAEHHAISVSWAGYSAELTRALQHDLPRGARWWSPDHQCWFVRKAAAAQLHRILRTHGEIRIWHVLETLERTAA